MNPPKVLLAKSLGKLSRPEEGRLVTHTIRVVEAAKVILEFLAPVLQLPGEMWTRLQRAVLASCFFHDLGKANSAFQIMVERLSQSTDKQPIRHEILSFLLTMDERYLGKWLREVLGSAIDQAIVACSAGGHHLKLNAAKDLVRSSGIGANITLQFFGAHKDSQALLRAVAKRLATLNQIPSLNDFSLSFIEDDDEQHPTEWLNDVITKAKTTLKQLDQEDKQILAFTKALTVAADVAGSALAVATTSPSRWIPVTLGLRLQDDHLDKIILDSLKGRVAHNFQRKVAASEKPVTVVIAGCGNGKTLAAYMWARKHAIGRKLFFCYPTTGTASVGYEDYLHAQTDLERTLIHGRSQVDLEAMAGTPDDDAFEENQRLESLKVWSQQAVVCTADTVLGLIQNQRRGLFSFPAIACGAFVFDEIHNYDKRMFGSLLRFLETFSHAPVLLMSASIPTNRLAILRQKLRDRLAEPIGGDSTLEELPRYVLRQRANAEACWPEVKQAIEEYKQKVLWVCNTVGDARKIYRQATEEYNLKPVILYHSRYRYYDRVKRQKLVLSHFPKDENGNPIFGEPVLIVATQVCEVSLNISAQLLVNALPPFTALMQRLGRLNRYAKREEGKADPSPQDALIYPFECPDNKPYGKNELAVARQALEQLYDEPKSQKDLADVLSKLPLYEEIENDSAWLDGVKGVWESDQLPLRKGDSSLTVLLEQNRQAIEDELRRKKQKPSAQTLAGWTVPMLFRKGLPYKDWPLWGGYRVVPQEWITYDETLGAEWRVKK